MVITKPGEVALSGKLGDLLLDQPLLNKAVTDPADHMARGACHDLFWVVVVPLIKACSETVVCLQKWLIR